MFQKLFGFGQRSRRVVIDGLYERIVAARGSLSFMHAGRYPIRRSVASR